MVVKSIGFEDPVGPFAGVRGMLPSAEISKIIGRAVPPAVVECRRSGGRTDRQDNGLMSPFPRLS
jgi:hypothetical protein